MVTQSAEAPSPGSLAGIGSSDESATPDGMRRWSYQVMGTTLNVIGPAAGEEAGPIVKALFDAWDRRFSRFKPDSELSRVNVGAGQPVEVSADFVDVTRAAISAAAATDGLFDPTLGARLVSLGYDRTFVELPADATQRLAAPWIVGAWRRIDVDPIARTVRIPAGSSLDFGGIAKGMAVDAALDALAERGIGPVAVDAGGDLAVRGTPPGLDGWPVDLADAGDTATVRIGTGALATSSTMRRHWLVAGERRHHLLDPRTGEPAATGIRSATVLAATCRVAEVAAKVTLLLGADDGRTFLEVRGLSGVLVSDDGTATPVGHWRCDETRGAFGAEGWST